MISKGARDKYNHNHDMYADDSCLGLFASPVNPIVIVSLNFGLSIYIAKLLINTRCSSVDDLDPQ